jgi:transposase
MIDGATVTAMAQCDVMVPTYLPDWRYLAREGKLVLPDPDATSIAAVVFEAPAAPPTPELKYGDKQIGMIQNEVTIRLSAETPAVRTAEFAASP